jgi:hypothetical protein
MLARVRSPQVRLLPHGPLDVIRQVALFVGAYYAYELVRGGVNGQVVPAFQHARQLISVERTLHVFVEPSIQAWASGSHWLIAASTWIYINAQTSITLASLVFLYLFRNRSFYFVRNMFLVSMGIALAGYSFFPTAPPRLLPEWGFFDSISDATGVHATNASVNAFFNQYAAVPSMHVGFAVMLGVTFARLSRRRVVQVIWLVYPLLVTFVTVVTANHFLADAVLGALTAAAAAYAASWLARTRPHVWGFSGAAPEAVPIGAAPAEAGAPA